MALKVIGAGTGRTGTMSLKLALDRIGFGPTYHLSDLIANPDHWPLWQQAIDGSLADFESIFRKYASAVDAPGWKFYRPLCERYPNAKVILTVRDPAAWFESAQATVLSDWISPIQAKGPKALFDVIHAIGLRASGPNIHNRDYMIDWFNAHNAEVRRAVDPNKLLVYEVSRGWEPLCRFLQVPIPAEPFPHANERNEMERAIRTRLSGIVAQS